MRYTNIDQFNELFLNLNSFFSSNKKEESQEIKLNQAVKLLLFEERRADPNAYLSASFSDRKKLTVMYYFSLNPEIATETEPLTKEQQRELLYFHKKIVDFFKKNAPAGVLTDEKALEIFYDFINTNDKELLPKIQKGIPDLFIYPIDKVNTEIFKKFPVGEKVALAVEKNGSNIKIDIDVLLQFKNISISRQLTQYDKEVFNAVANLRHQGNTRFTTGQIYSAMGYTNRITDAIKKKILNSLEVMRFVGLYIDNTEESEKYGYQLVKGHDYLLPVRFVESEVNGRIVYDSIELLGVPFLFKFALNRNQITTIQKSVLSLPISRTEENLAIKNYLIHRISRAKSNQKEKILLKTICAKCEITSRSQKSKLKEKLTSLLDHFKKTGYIKDYSLAADSVIIKFSTQK